MSGFQKHIKGVLNNTNFQGHIDPQARCISEASGGSKKFVQQGRSHFCAQSVLPVREHGKMARTPLAAFFNSPDLNGWRQEHRKG
ncbi:hypothetical protein [Nitrospira sp.]|uniref:hypothetical protein n=1 Tax=Nitrospira sp. TaxID=70125 RepID=UPI003FCE7D0A